MNQQKDFRDAVRRDSDRERRAERQRPGLFGILWYGGILGLLLVLPMVGGAYLGSWLDSLHPDFGSRWTVSLIMLGVLLGGWNVVWYVRNNL